MQLLLRWAISSGALYATIWLLALVGLAQPGKGPWWGWLIAGLVMGLVNAMIRPVAQFLTAPLNCLTFGIVGVLVNGLMFWLIPVILDALGMPVFRVEPLGALVGAVVVGLIAGAASKLLIREGEER